MFTTLCLPLHGFCGIIIFWVSPAPTMQSFAFSSAKSSVISISCWCLQGLCRSLLFLCFGKVCSSIHSSARWGAHTVLESFAGVQCVRKQQNIHTALENLPSYLLIISAWLSARIDGLDDWTRLWSTEVPSNPYHSVFVLVGIGTSGAMWTCRDCGSSC